jgi:hypothetical protein
LDSSWDHQRQARQCETAQRAERILNLSRLMNDEVQQAAAHSNLGSTCLWRGEFGAAREHLEKAIAVYDRDIPRYLPMPRASVRAVAQSDIASLHQGKLGKFVHIMCLHGMPSIIGSQRLVDARLTANHPLTIAIFVLAASG